MKPEKTKYPGVYRIGKNYFIDYYGPDKKRHREVAGHKLEDAVGRKEEKSLRIMPVIPRSR